MSNALAFDTLAYSKKLRSAGFTEVQAEIQAETIAELIDDKLATKQDILALKRDMKEMEISLKRDMKEMELTLKKDIKDSELRLTVRFGAMLTAGIAITATLVKLL